MGEGARKGVPEGVVGLGAVRERPDSFDDSSTSSASALSSSLIDSAAPALVSLSRSLLCARFERISRKRAAESSTPVLVLVLSTEEVESLVLLRPREVRAAFAGGVDEPCDGDLPPPNQLLLLSPAPAPVVGGEVEAAVAVAAEALDSLHEDRLKLERLDELDPLLIGVAGPSGLPLSPSLDVLLRFLALAVVVAASLAEVVDSMPSCPATLGTGSPVTSSTSGVSLVPMLVDSSPEPPAGV